MNSYATIQKESSIFDGFLYIFAMMNIIFVIISVFEYFYSSYIFYSLFVLIILLLLLGYIYFYKYISLLSFNSLVILVIVYSIWFIPEGFHKYIIQKNFICLEAQLKSKRFIRYNEHRGKIKFTILNKFNMPKELLFFDTFYGVPKDQYDNLPLKGSKIKICGEISKIGFSFDYVETVRDENVSIEP